MGIPEGHFGVHRCLESSRGCCQGVSAVGVGGRRQDPEGWLGCHRKRQINKPFKHRQYLLQVKIFQPTGGKGEMAESLRGALADVRWSQADP